MAAQEASSANRPAEYREMPLFSDAPINAGESGAYGAGQGREAPSNARVALRRAIAPAQSRSERRASPVFMTFQAGDPPGVGLGSRRRPAARVTAIHLAVRADGRGRGAIQRLFASLSVHVVQFCTKALNFCTMFAGAEFRDGTFGD
jgi:hypothetical protein